MIKVVLLGSGNVAYHLALGLKKATGFSVIQRYARNSTNDYSFNSSIPVARNLKDLAKADIYIIAVKDDAIASLSDKMSGIDGLVVHTSGSIGLSELNDNLRRGVLYPAQSLTINLKIDLKKVPLVIEAGSNDDLTLLNQLASSLSKNVYQLNSIQREKLHIAAVFANNFSNYMFICAENLCNEANIPFEILKPLILETGQKVQDLNPSQAQTGPARRNDQVVIQKHLNELSGEKKEIYKIVSDAIIKTYEITD